jgi:transmembrane sensor
LETIYSHYTSSDFLTDDTFVDHQLMPTKTSHALWQSWLETQPANLDEWKQAIFLLDSIRLGLDDYASTHLPESIVSELLAKIKLTNNAKTQTRSLKINYRWLAAASVVIAVTVGSMFWKRSAVRSDYQLHISKLAPGFTERINQTAQVQDIRLPDGSLVALLPNSRISYPDDFNTVNRKVLLSGEASFEVTKDVRKPFLVYANKVVTRVLGTKFLVRAYESETDVKVNVESGQVSVYRETSDHIKIGKTPGKGLLLLPNQQAVFSRESEEFSKTLVEDPEILSLKHSDKPTFIYDEVSISQVFEDIENAYGITIRYNQEGLEGCQLSASLNHESFDQKLEIICKTVKATYQKFDGQIIITGGNCE